MPLTASAARIMSSQPSAIRWLYRKSNSCRYSRRDVVIGAVNAAFQDREEALDRVRVNVAAHVLFRRVHDRFVRREATAEADVNPRLVGMQPGLPRNRMDDDRAQRRRRDIRDMMRRRPATTLN